MEGGAKRVEAVLRRLGCLHPKLIDLSLERGLGLLERLGNPHLDLPPVIHVAGTNGKGSVVAFMRAMLEAWGGVVHAYTSPHLVRFNERIRIAGRLISDEALASVLEEVEAVNGSQPMTFFEITTAAAFLAFSREAATATLLETGLGGRADSTNVVPRPLATVITPIARDHEHFLGDTLGAIAGEKAGIMREGVPCFSAAQSRAAAAVLRREAEGLGTPFFMAGEDFGYRIVDGGPDGGSDGGVEVALGGREVFLPRLGLRGEHQAGNSALAVAALVAAFPGLSDGAFAAGASAASWPGRIEPLAEGVLVDKERGGVSVWLDGAHNAHGAEALVATLKEIAPSPWVLVCGALDSRDPRDFLRVLRGVVGGAIAIEIPGQESSMPADAVRAAADDVGIEAHVADDIKAALRGAYRLADVLGGHIIISGSLYLAGHVLDVNGTCPD